MHLTDLAFASYTRSQLRAEIDALKAQLAERDSKIRVLEVENEK